MSAKEWDLSEADRDNRFYRRKEDAEEIDGFRQALIDEKAANQVLRTEIERLTAIEKAARAAYAYHAMGYNAASDFDANTQLELMDALGRALEEK